MTEAVARASPVRPWGRALGWLAVLGPFFFASYGFATWVTAQRPQVGSMVFAWEQAIPFLPWTIIPYWSIDLLYGLSLFVCAGRRELDTHAKRLLTAQVVAVSFFLIFPLRFTFERPAAGGLFGWLFAMLETFDQPFNQAPSLHVALLVILWALFARKLHGAARLLLDAWFALIAVSVLTTWQHHFVDIPAGALLGFFCLWLWPQDGPSPMATARTTVDPQRRRLAARYAFGAAVCVAAAFLINGAALWLVWVSVALTLVALNYAWLGADGFQKRDGHLSAGAAALLAPYLAGAFANSRLWTRGHPPADHVADDVWIGRLPTRGDLERGAFDAIVDLACELPVDPGTRAYANIRVLDLTLPDRAALIAAARAIERARAHGRVLVCCALGYTRSAMAVAAWLVASGREPGADAAIARIRTVRPRIVLDHAHVALVASVAALDR